MKALLISTAVTAAAGASVLLGVRSAGVDARSMATLSSWETAVVVAQQQRVRWPILSPRKCRGKDAVPIMPLCRSNRCVHANEPCLHACRMPCGWSSRGACIRTVACNEESLLKKRGEWSW